MPKVKVSLFSQLNNYVTEFDPKVFSTDGKIFYCKICDIKCGSAKRFNVTQHLTTAKHLKLVAQKEKNVNVKKAQQRFLTDTKKSCFNRDLCSAMLSANIPLNKLNNESFKSFLVKYTGKIIPAVTTLRKGYVDEIYDETLIKIKNAVIDKKIWVSIDQTTDSLGRFVANIIIVEKMVQEKMNDVLAKNEGYQTLAQISKILTGEETLMVRIPENLSLGDFAYFKYAPINSVDVERSFSMFKVLLSDNRKSFTFDNLKKRLIVQCNFQVVEEVESFEEVSS
ncbi:hypothetical protein QTP88_017482 [Uroleucon formosanum]